MKKEQEKEKKIFDYVMVVSKENCKLFIFPLFLKYSCNQKKNSNIKLFLAKIGISYRYPPISNEKKDNMAENIMQFCFPEGENQNLDKSE